MRARDLTVAMVKISTAEGEIDCEGKDEITVECYRYRSRYRSRFDARDRALT